MAPEKRLSTQGLDAAKLRFVAKEAYFKAVFPSDRKFLDFLDIRVRINATLNAFEVRVAVPEKPNAQTARRQVIGRLFGLRSNRGGRLFRA